MKIMTIHWPTGMKRVLVEDDGRFPEADLADTVQARLSYLYPHPVNHLVRNVPNADAINQALSRKAIETMHPSC